MVRDFLADFLGDDAALLLSRSLVPIAIFILTLIVRRLVPVALRRLFRPLDQFTSRFGLMRENLLDTALDVLVPPLRLIVTIVGLWTIVLIVEIRQDGFRRDINSVFVSLAMLAVFWAMYRMVSAGFAVWYKRTRAAGLESRFDETLIQFLTRLAEATVIIFAIVTIMQQWGINLTGLLAGLGLGGLAVALAAQDALSNLIGYFAIIGDQPFKVGDYIISGDFEGVVEVIGFRTTQIRRPDRALVVVPNRVLANEVVTNWSHTIYGPKRGRVRLHATVGVTYDTTADQMEAVVAEIRDQINSHERFLPGSVVVHFVEFGASSLDIMIVGVARVSSWNEIQSTREEVNLIIMRIIAGHQLSIAFPTRTIILEQGTEPSTTIEAPA